MTKRTDVHSPSNIIPEDYEFVVMRSRVDEEWGGARRNIAIFNAHCDKTGGKFSTHEHGGRCMVCGAHMIDYAIFYHEPTNSYIRTGGDCAGHIDAGLADAFRRHAQLRRKAAERNAKRKAAEEVLERLGILDYVETMFYGGELGGPIVHYNEVWPGLPEHIDVENDPYWYDKWVETEEYRCKEHILWEYGCHLGHEVVKNAPMHMIKRADGKFYTLVEMVRNLVKFGSWSEKQANYAVKLTESLINFKEEVLEWRKEHEALPDAPEGRLVVRGEVMSVKEKEDPYTGGITLKMLVKADEGYKIWSTVPKAILGVERGAKVEMTVTLKPSPDDPKFAFGSRPSKAKIL